MKLASIFILGGLLFSAAAAHADTLGERIVKFAQAHKGQQVGRGECADLAQLALEEAGAKPFRRARGDSAKEDKGDIVWGKFVASLEGTKSGYKRQGNLAEIKPGDIIQYKDALFEATTKRGHYSGRAKQHTAIVAGVSKLGWELKILEQNRNGEKHVTENTAHLRDLKEGSVHIYRPQPKEKE